MIDELAGWPKAQWAVWCLMVVAMWDVALSAVEPATPTGQIITAFVLYALIQGEAWRDASNGIPPWRKLRGSP